MFRPLLIAVGLLTATATEASAQEDAYRLEYCGYTFPVASYVAALPGLDVALTANDRLVVNGTVLAERNPWRRDEPPRAWYDSANTADIAVGKREFVVRTSATDCIDYQSTRIYVLSDRGELRGAFTYAHSWERVVLSYRGADIVYTTNYYCEFSDGAPDGEVWSHVLSGGGNEFVRESMPRTDVCDGNDAKAVGLLLQFMPMRPIVPLLESTQ